MTRIETRKTAVLTAIVAIALAGCSVLGSPKRTAWTTYVLEGGEVERSEPVAAAPSADAPMLRVAPIEAAAGYDSPRMAYTRSSGEIEYFAAHRWAEPPSVLLVPLLVEGIERTGTFAAVLPPTSRASGDLLLETELLVFRQEFDGQARFHARVRAALVDEGQGAVIGAVRTFDLFESMDGENPAAGARAAQKAATRLASEIGAFCASAAASRPAASLPTAP